MNIYRVFGRLAPPAFLCGSALLGLGLFRDGLETPGFWGVVLIGFGLAAIYLKLEELATTKRT